MYLPWTRGSRPIDRREANAVNPIDSPFLYRRSIFRAEERSLNGLARIQESFRGKGLPDTYVFFIVYFQTRK